MNLIPVQTGTLKCLMIILRMQLQTFHVLLVDGTRKLSFHDNFMSGEESEVNDPKDFDAEFGSLF